MSEEMIAITPKEHFTFDKNFQAKIVQALIVDRPWAAQMNEVLDTEYFTSRYLKLVASTHLEYYKKYKEFPSIDLLVSELKDQLRNKHDVVLLDQVKSFLKKVKGNDDLGDLPLVKDKSLDWCKRRRLTKALLESVDLVDSENYDKVIELVKTAIHAGNHHSPGLDLFEDVESRYSETYRRTVSTGIAELDQRKILNGGLGAGELGVCVAPTGCHAKGSLILMFDGTTKKIEDIKVHDKLMGPDSKPRNVLRCLNGEDELYEVETSWGYKAVFNKQHTLALQSSVTKKHVEITIEKYLSSSSWFKHTHFWQQPKVGIEFQKSKDEFYIGPYLLGLLLGDGYLNKKRVEITTCDKEIVKECQTFAQTKNLRR